MATPNGIATHTTWTPQDHKERISGKNSFWILSFVIPVNKPGVREHVFPECNVMHYSPGLADWVFPECSQSVPWFCFERVSKFFLKSTKGPTTCRQGLHGSHTLHLGLPVTITLVYFTTPRNFCQKHLHPH